MAQNGRSVFQRIRSVKSSLENAEQSFLDNNGMRGELDLMLAEAELKNLRHKKDFPWSWNRQVLAMCVAALLALAGLGGWYYAYDSIAVAGKKQSTEAVTIAKPVLGKVVTSSENEKTIILPFGDQTINNVPAARQADYSQQVKITEVDMRRLVQSARVELSNSK
ncbi:MAG: hypothetical protein IJV92_04140 [Phascolarctobacterium sp.]|nr:hypothetical protein [Phascolarctobacterium sp.]